MRRRFVRFPEPMNQRRPRDLALRAVSPDSTFGPIVAAPPRRRWWREQPRTATTTSEPDLFTGRATWTRRAPRSSRHRPTHAQDPHPPSAADRHVSTTSAQRGDLAMVDSVLPVPDGALRSHLLTADPGLIGLLGFVIATLTAQLEHLGVQNEAPVFWVGAVFGGVVQVTAGMLSYFRGDNFHFVVYNAFGWYWIVVPGFLLGQQVGVFQVTGPARGVFAWSSPSSRWPSPPAPCTTRSCRSRCCASPPGSASSRSARSTTRMRSAPRARSSCCSPRRWPPTCWWRSSTGSP